MIVWVDTSHSILRFAKRFFAGTLLSRISGVARDVAMAFCFGSAPEIAAFMVAYRLANLFRRLFGEGNLQAGFIPHFEAIGGRDPHAALLFYRDTSFSLLALLLGAVGLMEALLWGAAMCVGPEWAQIVYLAMWMAPGLLFVCLYALNSAFLQCQKSFFLPAAAPALFNLAWIAIALLASQEPVASAVRILSIGITFAFAVQWILTSFRVCQHTRSIGWKEWFQPRLFSTEWRQLIRPLSLGIVGIGAMQVNSALDAIFSRIADPSGPAYLWYAIRVQQLPLAIFGIALSGALLPSLSRAMREGAFDRYRNLLETALRHSAALMVPCTFGIFALGGYGLNLLYGHGDFSASDVQETLYCLWGYGAGLVPAVFVLLLASGFYARKEYALPTIASVASMILNGALNAWMVFGLGWGATSIAIGTSASAFANCLILSRGLGPQIGPVFSSSFGRFIARLIGSGALATAATSIGCYWMVPFPRGATEQLLQLSLSTAIFAGAFLASAYSLRLREFFELFRGQRG